MNFRVGLCGLLAFGLAGVYSIHAQPAANAQPDERAGAPAATDHWSFQPIRRPVLPTVQNRAWIRNPIDAFVLARLEAADIPPSPEADRATLIRRLSLDLLGLPPTPAEVDTFLNDDRPNAYEELIDRTLRSPHFGERWGRHWLDLARYADSDGYEKDSPRPYAYIFRDWVIDAINRDMPFDQFTIEQLAGDLVPVPGEETAGNEADPETIRLRRIATGFHRNTLTNREGGVDQEEFRNKANADRVNTTSTVWLGLTLACAECHNHKFDPLTQHEYYGLFAFFNTSQEADEPVPALPAELAAYENAKRAFDEGHAKLLAAREQFEREQLPNRLAAWEKSLEGRVPAARWRVLEAIQAASAGGATLARQSDGSIQADGQSPATDTYTIEAATELDGITAIRLEVLPVPSHPAKGPGRVAHGNFVLNEITVEVQVPGEAPWRAVPLQNAIADFSQDKYAVASAIDGNPDTGWAVAPRFGQRHVAVFETKETLSGSTSTLRFKLDQQYGTEHTIGRLRLSVTRDPRPVPLDDVPDTVLAVLQVPGDQRTDSQRNELAKYYQSTDAEWKKLDAAATANAKKAPARPAPKAMAIAQNANPPKTNVHIRGDFLRKGDEVAAGVPAVLGSTVAFQPRGQKPDRLDLARWLVDPRHPLTARVAVNRTWQYLFGRPLVDTPNDFGTRGESPTHPELLDWLASTFMAPAAGDPAAHASAGAGWSVKRLIKLIVSSATYRQSSALRPELVDRDPTNTLLARQNRFRLEAEIVRDLNLAVAGLLSPAIGGPSVRPPQPPGISELTYANSAKWVESTGGERYRRGLYTWFQRTSPYPMLTTFDSPDGVNCTVRRERSNTPLQALTLLNDSVFVECAQGLARRMIAEAPSLEPNERIRRGFRLAMAREPLPEERNLLRRTLDTFLAACANDPELAGKLAGPSLPEGVDTSTMAAWVALARTILNLDEFVTRE